MKGIRAKFVQANGFLAVTSHAATLSLKAVAFKASAGRVKLFRKLPIREFLLESSL